MTKLKELKAAFDPDFDDYVDRDVAYFDYKAELKRSKELTKMSVYTAEETNDGVWSIIDLNVGGTGARVLDLQSRESAEFYAEMMNLVYGRVMRDVKEITK